MSSGDAARPRAARNDVRTLSDALAIDNQLASAALDRVRSLKTKLTKVRIVRVSEMCGERKEGETGWCCWCVVFV